MSEYPEHDKLIDVKDESEAIGRFIDYGLPGMHMHLAERVEIECECARCQKGRTTDYGDFLHREASRIDAELGIAYFERYYPTNKSIERILAEWFEIDLDKISDEKMSMLKAMANA